MTEGTTVSAILKHMLQHDTWIWLRLKLKKAQIWLNPRKVSKSDWIQERMHSLKMKTAWDCDQFDFQCEAIQIWTRLNVKTGFELKIQIWMCLIVKPLSKSQNSKLTVCDCEDFEHEYISKFKADCVWLWRLGMWMHLKIQNWMCLIVTTLNAFSKLYLWHVSKFKCQCVWLSKLGMSIHLRVQIWMCLIVKTLNVNRSLDLFDCEDFEMKEFGSESRIQIWMPAHLHAKALPHPNLTLLIWTTPLDPYLWVAFLKSCMR